MIVSGGVHDRCERYNRGGFTAQNALAHGADMQAGDSGKIRFVCVKAALGTRDHGNTGNFPVRIQNLVERFPLAGSYMKRARSL